LCLSFLELLGSLVLRNCSFGIYIAHVYIFIYMYINTYIYIYIHIDICIYIYIYPHYISSSDTIVSQISRTSGKSSTEKLFLLQAITGNREAVALIPFGQLDKRDVTVAGGTAPHPLRAGEWNSGAVGENAKVFQADVLLLSLKSFGVHVRIRLGGLVMARSVKFLGKLEATLSDQETREGWWEELRDEIKNHARTVCCTHIIGYTETCTIYGDVCVLSAVGTAAVVKYLGYPTVLLNTTQVAIYIYIYLYIQCRYIYVSINPYI
jgi:hypothetical protein